MSKRGAHHAYSACFSATGVIVDPFWTVQGARVSGRFVKGTKRSRFNPTHNGWADTTSNLLFLKHFKEHMTAHGLAKALLIMDNCDVHTDPICMKYCVDNDITLLFLPASVTHRMQPADVKFFGLIEPMMVAAAEELRLDYNENTLARLLEFVLDRLVAKQPDFAAKAFRQCGLVPFDFDVHEQAGAFSASDAAYGYAPGCIEQQRAAEVPDDVVRATLDQLSKEKHPESYKKLEAAVAVSVKRKKVDLTRCARTAAEVVAAIADEILAKEAALTAKEARQAAKAAKAAGGARVPVVPAPNPPAPPAGSGAPMAAPEPGPVIVEPPPPVQTELMPVAPGLGYVWVGGYWAWHLGRHVWISGRWVLPPAGYVWAPGWWARHGPGWRWHGGYWRRR